MGELYPNAPLIETVFEIRFPADLAIEATRHEYFAEVKDEFPRIFFPQIQLGEAPPLKPLHFQAADGERTLLVSVNQFGYSAKKYPGFAAFKVDALRHVRRFAGRYGISDLRRTGLRYMNVIPFAREDGLIPLHRYIRLNSQPVAHYELRTVAPVGPGLLTTRLEVMHTVDQSQEVLYLDFDYAKTEPLAVADLDDYLEESHAHTKAHFERLIADEYRSIIRGEVIT